MKLSVRIMNSAEVPTGNIPEENLELEWQQIHSDKVGISGILPITLADPYSDAGVASYPLAQFRQFPSRH